MPIEVANVNTKYDNAKKRINYLLPIYFTQNGLKLYPKTIDQSLL